MPNVHPRAESAKITFVHFYYALSASTLPKYLLLFVGRRGWSFATNSYKVWGASDFKTWTSMSIISDSMASAITFNSLMCFEPHRRFIQIAPVRSSHTNSHDFALCTSWQCSHHCLKFLRFTFPYISIDISIDFPIETGLLCIASLGPTCLASADFFSSQLRPFRFSVARPHQ